MPMPGVSPISSTLTDMTALSYQRSAHHEQLIAQALQLAQAPAEEKESFLDSLSGDDLELLMWEWEFWARPEQLEPDPATCVATGCQCGGNWRTWLIMSGRGWGKTRSGAEWVHKQIRNGVYRRGHIMGATAADIRDIMIEGDSGLINTSPPWFRAKYRPTKRRVEWPNGAFVLAFSADEPERLRGEQCEFAWSDELAAWRYPDAWTQLMLGLRLGKDPKVIVTTTPRPTQLIKDLFYAKSTHVTRGITYDNLANLAATFTDEITRVYEGQRIGRQELYGELLFDLEGALWSRSQLDEHRVTKEDFSKLQMKRIVVAVDPAVSYGESSDETGILVCGLSTLGEGYVLADLSGKMRVEDWSRRVVEAFHTYRADRIIAEKNQGYDLVSHTIRTYDENVPLKMVHAAQGKRTRAEPVAGLYEQGRIHHVGVFAKLEDQMCGWEPGDLDSPDRVDALVWGFSELMVGPQRKRLAKMTIDKGLHRVPFWKQ